MTINIEMKDGTKKRIENIYHTSVYLIADGSVGPELILYINAITPKEHIPLNTIEHFSLT